MRSAPHPADSAPRDRFNKNGLGDCDVVPRLFGADQHSAVCGSPKSMRLKVDKAQFSRWLNGTEGITWPKLVAPMDECGNDAPVSWMLAARGYDLHSVRRLESETQRQNRLLREENAALRRALIGSA